MTAEIHLIHRDLRNELKSHVSPEFNRLFATGLLDEFIPRVDEALFGGPAGGSMGETTNEVGPAVEGLTVAVLMGMKHKILASPPQAVEWATSDMERVKRAIMADLTMVPMSDEEMEGVTSPMFYGMPIVLDKDLPPDVLIEMRDQHGNCLGRVLAS